MTTININISIANVNEMTVTPASTIVTGYTLEHVGIAEIVHKALNMYRKSIGELSLGKWDLQPSFLKAGMIRSVGIIADSDIDPETEHRLWVNYYKKTGWKYGKTKDVVNQLHPCVTDWKNLDVIQQLKTMIFIHTVKELLKYSKHSIDNRQINNPDLAMCGISVVLRELRGNYHGSKKAVLKQAYKLFEGGVME